MTANTPNPREGAAFGTFKKDDGSEGYVLFGGRNSSQYFRDTWELSLDPFGWQKVSETQSEVGNIVGGFIQQYKTPDKDRIFLLGGVDEEGYSDHPTWERDRARDKWVKRSHEDKIENFDSTPDTVDWLGLAKIEDNDPTINYALSFPLMLAWDAGNQHPLRYYHANTNKWRWASRADNSKIIQAYGSYVWLEWPEGNLPCRMYILGGYDKNGNPLKLFQTVDLDFKSDQPPPFPPSAELVYYSNHTVLADDEDSLFVIDADTPLFEGDPLVADGIASIRLANNSESRINTPIGEITSSSCIPTFPLQSGVWDDELGWLDRNQLDTHVILPFSTFAQVRLIELYIVKATGEIKVRVPLEDFGPHPELPQNRRNFSVTGVGVDSQNRCEGIALFGGSMNNVVQNDLWVIKPQDVGTQNQRFIWDRLN